MRVHIFIATLLCVFVVNVSAQQLSVKPYVSPYVSEWHKVSVANNEKMPADAEATLRKIFSRAIADGHLFESLRAYEQLINIKTEIDYQSRYASVDTLITNAKLYPHAPISALYELLLARTMNQTYPRGNDLSTNTAGLNYEKWSNTMCSKAIEASIDKIISIGDTLRYEPVGIYGSFIYGDRKPEVPSNNLYVALLNASISISSGLNNSDSVKTALYRKLLAQTRDDAPLYITTYTDYIEYLNSKQPGTNKIYADSLSKLIARYPSEPTIVRAIEANIYLENPKLWQSNEQKVFLSLDSLCRATVKRFPNSPYIDRIKSISKRLHDRTLKAKFPKQLYPGMSAEIEVEYRNMTNITLSVWHLDGVTNITAMNLAQDSLPKIVEGKKPVWSKKQTFAPPLYLEQTGKIPVAIEREGIYVIGAQSTDAVKMSYSLLYVSRVGYMYRGTGGITSLFVADFESGKPFQKAEVSLCSETVDVAKNKIVYGKSSTQKLTLDGFTPIKLKDTPYPRSDRNWSNYAIDYGKDRFSPTTTIYSWSPRTVVQRQACYIVTDRTRYMPGDTVRYKGVVYTQTDMGVDIDASCRVIVNFRNPSFSTIESDTLNSDAWGSFNGYFVTKQKALNGQYTIETDNASAYVKVESYKTPTFAIELDNPSRGYALGDTLKLIGRLEAFAGYPLSSITVECTAGEREMIWRRVKGDNTIQSYRVKCSPNGDFEIALPTKPNASKLCSYQVTLKATDIKGESQEITRDFILGEYRYILSGLSSYKVVNKDEPLEFTPRAQTFWGNIDSLKGKYSITDSKGGSINGSFLSGVKNELDLKSLASGECKMNLSLDGDDSYDFTQRKFILFSPQDRALPVDTLIFFASTNTAPTATKPITFTLGTNQSELYAQISLTYGDSLIYSESRIFKHGMNNYVLPYSDKYPDNTRLYVNFIRGGKPYTLSRDISRAIEKEALTLRLVTERKAAPGAKESIGIEVKNGAGNGVEADVTISVFDKSSEKYRKNIYRKINNSPISAGYIALNNGSCFSSQQIYTINDYIYNRQSNIIEDTPYLTSNVVVTGYGASKSKTITGSLAPVKAQDISNDNIMIGGKMAASAPENIPDPVRRNFRQTAAFFPNVRTDANGIARVSYTMPDALTTYRIEAMAYTKKLDSAVASGEIVVSKDVMIIPNTPLFIRLGDEITIKATVVNNSDKTQQVTASLTLSNPDKPNAKIDFNGTKSLTLAPMSSQVVEWSISHVPDVSVLAIMASVETATQRDSEERLVAILSPDESILGGKTYIISNDSVRIDLRKFLKDGATDEMMVVNSLSTPILLLNSLPYEKEVKRQNAIDMIESWYLSSVGHDMVRRYRTYISSLAKDLKTGYNPLKDYSQITQVLADETPWARQSEQPEERLRAMNDYLDGKATVARNREMFWAIEKLQNPDGGISWFTGMPSSPALTAMFLDRYASLLESKYYSRCKDRLFLTSMAYLDRAITEQFKQDSIVQLNSKTKGLALSTDLLNNLYIRSRFNDSIPRTRHDSIAFERLLQRAEKSWRKGSIMDMTLTALAMQNRGKDITPILNSLSQYAVKGPDGVVNYPNAVKYRSLISSETRAHALLMKLLTANETTTSLGEGVARWLMLQRHNQQWANNSATADAVQGLWRHYTTTGKPQNQVKIHSLYPKVKGSVTLPYGNFVSTEALRIGSGTITVVNQNDMPRFVDVIYRYSAPMKDIEPRAEGISVTRKLLREKVVGDKKVLDEITESTPLNIGDIVVVRNILDSDADYSFVMLESKRSGATLPVDDSSGYRNGHYRDVKASTTNNFFYTLPRGVTTLDERLFITYEGKFSDGIAKVVSLQNPTKGGNTASGKINVK